jgi:hypothetical protein
MFKSSTYRALIEIHDNNSKLKLISIEIRILLALDSIHLWRYFNFTKLERFLLNITCIFKIYLSVLCIIYVANGYIDL